MVDGNVDYTFLAVDDTSVDDQQAEPWIIGIIDDEPLVHQATRFALQDVEIDGRPLLFLSAYSGEQGYELIRQQPEMALVFIDVIMEREDSGLVLVDRIRNELGNKLIQIVIRTGRPGDVPEEDVITRYAINSYRTKNELTRNRLFIVIATGLRNFSLLQSINSSRNSLRSLITAAGNILQHRSVKDFSNAVLLQFCSLFDLSYGCVFCVSKFPSDGPFIYTKMDKSVTVFAASHSFTQYQDKDLESLDLPIFQVAKQALAAKRHVFEDDFGCLYLSTSSGWEGVIVAEQGQHLQHVDREILQIFCLNVATGLENSEYYTHLSHAVFKDKLTGLNNRTGFINQAGIKMRSQRQVLCLYLLDIDYFHQVITSLGYEFGNLILKKMASVLVELFGEGAITGRLHSDVFAILVADAKLSAAEVATKCAQAMNIEGQSIRMGLTVGMSVSGDKTEYVDDIDIMMRRAEMALHVAKDHWRGSGEVFNESYEQESYQNMQLLSDFREGLTSEQLFLVLQPKVDIRNSQVIGFEALIRWQHPKRGLVPPGGFIPAVEKSGIYYELDLYVARALCRMLNSYPQLQAPVSFNISAKSLNHETFVAELMAVFSEHKIEFSRVEIEVTENALIHSEQSIARIHALYNAGFKIGLDDFGAGFSSLAYLLRLPLHTIKIDRGFVGEIVENAKSLTLLEGMLAIINKLDKEIIVEGVETIKQRDLLIALGVTQAQGFLFYKPLSIEKALALLDDQ